MLSTVLAIHEGLGVSRRLPALPQAGLRISALELATLGLLGIVAAVASAFVKLGWGIPGHNIIRVIFPMALGLALVPRRGSATVMGLSGLAAAAALSFVGPRGIGFGALTSLALTGFLLDLALLGARTGRSVYVRLAMAGLAANLAAMLVRGGVKLAAGGMIDGQPFPVWWPRAVLTYPIAGLLAGLLSAAVWFRVTADSGPGTEPPAGA